MLFLRKNKQNKYENESGTEIGNFEEIRFRQQVFISSCWAKTVSPQTLNDVSWLPSAAISHFKRSPRLLKSTQPLRHKYLKQV